MLLKAYKCCESYDLCVFFQAEDGIRDLVRSRGLGDVYKRQVGETPRVAGNMGRRQLLQRAQYGRVHRQAAQIFEGRPGSGDHQHSRTRVPPSGCLLYTSDAADERSSVDLGGRRIIKKKNKEHDGMLRSMKLK